MTSSTRYSRTFDHDTRLDPFRGSRYSGALLADFEHNQILTPHYVISVILRFGEPLTTSRKQINVLLDFFQHLCFYCCFIYCATAPWMAWLSFPEASSVSRQIFELANIVKLIRSLGSHFLSFLLSSFCMRHFATASNSCLFCVRLTQSCRLRPIEINTWAAVFDRFGFSFCVFERFSELVNDSSHNRP